MRNNLDRYGIPGREVYNLSKRWQRKVRSDCVWECFDSFVFWCSVSGYGPGKNLRKHREDEPHGPGNSYWYVHSEEVMEKHEKVQQDRKIVSPFCQGCRQKCPIGKGGCAEYKNWYVKNWNRNIYRKPAPPVSAPEVKQVREKFQYEHPDLVRDKMRAEMSDEPSQCDGVDEDCPRRRK